MDGVKSKFFLSEDFLDPYPTLAVPSPALITPLPANTFPDRLAPSVPNSILRNLHFLMLHKLLLIIIQNLQEI